ALLREAGATEVGVFRTGPWLLDLSAREFFERVIRDQLAARGLVEGPNFAFGHDRQGDVSILRGWCAESGIDFEVVEETRVDGHLLEFSGDLYGKSVELEFLEQLRSTRQFSSIDELLQQIRADVDQTRRVCEAQAVVSGQ